MDIKKVDMSYDRSCDPCCGISDSNYPIGFFLNPKQVAALGIPADIEPETMLDAGITLKIKSVTKREGETEVYACVTEMGIASAAKPSPNAKMADAYSSKGEEDHGD